MIAHSPARWLTPLIAAAPLLMMHLAAPTRAESVAVNEAVRLLAKARAADEKCSILNAGERDELASYIARAEVAAVERGTVAAAQSALKRGGAEGHAAACGDVAAQETETTLAAARDAVAAADASQEEQVTEDQSPPSAEPKRETVQKPARQEVSAIPEGLMARYAAAAEAYYVERRCNYLSRREVGEFYAAIVTNHRAAVKRFGAPAVKAALVKAESRAAGQRCNGAAETRIASAYRTLR
jgi:hypothetical protein